MGGQQVLRSWLVFDLTQSELALGMISAVVAVPMLLMAPIGGAVADRLDRRRLVAGGQAVVVAAEAAVLGLLVAGVLVYWHLLVLAAVMGVVFPFIMPARQAIVADVVGRDRMSNAMALNMAAVNTTRVLGPAAGGFLIGAVGLGRAYGINVGLFIAALSFMGGVRPSKAAGDSRSLSMRRNIADGFRYVGENRLVLVLLFFGLVPMFLALPFQSLLVVFARDVWDAGPQGFGMLSASAGVGGVVGAVIVAWRSSSRRRLRTMMVSVFGFGVALLLFALSPSFWLALPLAFLATLFVSLFGALNNTAIQLLIPDRVRGRVSSFLMMSFSLPLLGTLPVSAVAEVWGAPIAVAGGSVLAVVAAVVFYLASPALRQMDQRILEAIDQPGGPEPC